VGTRAPAVAKDADAECAAGPANESKTYPSIDSMVKELSAQYINDMKKPKLVENGAVGEKDPYEIALEKIQELGDVDIRAVVGQRFQKAHKPNTAGFKAYNADRSYAAKQAFRQFLSFEASHNFEK
jgi:hypothetical protein